MRKASFRHFCIVVAVGGMFAAPAAANPLLPPTVEYAAEVEVTRGSGSTAFEPVIRHIYTLRKLRYEVAHIAMLFDLDRQQAVMMTPQLKEYRAPMAFGQPPIPDPRLWVGVMAETATAIGFDTVLGRPVIRYRVRGTIFDNRVPFEGDVWTTADNIVLRAAGIGSNGTISAPVSITTVRLNVGAVDPDLLTVPTDYRKAAEP